MNHIVHCKVIKKKLNAPCGWEITYIQAITNAQFHLHQDFMNESDFQIIEGFTQSVCEICQWNVGLKWLVAPSHQLAFTGVQPE